VRRIETIIILLALLFYVWFLRRFGLSEVLTYLQLVGWGLVFTIALEAVARVANTLGWRVTVPNYPKGLRFSQLFVARIAGESIDYVTPSAQLGGQFVMALMVRRKLAMEVGLATVAVAALAEMLGQIGFVSSALLMTVRFEGRIHSFMLPTLGGLAIAIGLAGGFLYVQLKRPFSHLWRAAARLNLPELASPEIRAAAADADTLLVDFYLHHRGRLIASIACYLVAWSMGPLEIFIYLKLLGQAATWTVVLLVEALGLLIERATFLVPAKLVSQEGGKALILSMLGYPVDVGFAVGFLRRMKEMVWVLFGLVGLALHRMVAERGEHTIVPQTKDRRDVREAQRGITTMKNFTAALTAMVLLGAAGVAFAGVVVDEQQVVANGTGQPVTHSRTVMIEGNKQKSIVEGGESVVTDLDSGTMRMMSSARRAYLEIPFPPKGAMAGMMQGPGTSAMTFKKTGAQKKIAGYPCNEYVGSGSMAGNEYTIKGCFSMAAPGAADFTAFQRTMAQKVKGTSMAMMGQVPDGVPLEIASTSKVTHVSMPGMSAEQSSKVNKMLANRPPTTTHTTVTKVAEQKLSPETFAVPAGYHKQQMGPMGPGMGANTPHPGTSSPNSAAPRSKIPE
jgi:glycosyltransferase 2 family protein